MLFSDVCLRAHCHIFTLFWIAVSYMLNSLMFPYTFCKTALKNPLSNSTPLFFISIFVLPPSLSLSILSIFLVNPTHCMLQSPPNISPVIFKHFLTNLLLPLCPLHISVQVFDFLTFFKEKKTYGLFIPIYFWISGYLNSWMKKPLSFSPISSIGLMVFCSIFGIFHPYASTELKSVCCKSSSL